MGIRDNPFAMGQLHGAIAVVVDGDEIDERIRLFAARWQFGMIFDPIHTDPEPSDFHGFACWKTIHVRFTIAVSPNLEEIQRVPIWERDTPTKPEPQIATVPVETMTESRRVVTSAISWRKTF